MNIANARGEEAKIALQTPFARQKTIEAIKAYSIGKWDLARRKFAESGDPLANRIFLWLLFTQTNQKNWDVAQFAALSRFIRQNPTWPSITKLKTLAETIMPANISGQEVLSWYKDYPPQTGKGMSRYMDALIEQGRQNEAKKFLINWWANTLTSREEQKMMFQKYKPYLTIEAHKKRFDALLLDGRNDTARAIADVLGQGYPELAAARIALAEQNKNASALVSRVPRNLQNDPGLLYERLRWRRKNNLDAQAIEILNNAPNPAHIQNPESWWEERNIITRRLMEAGDFKAAYRLVNSHGLREGTPYAEAEWLAGWLALRFMNKPDEAYDHFSSMYEKVETPISKARGAYWIGRAADAQKQKDLAKSWYKKAAAYQTVYYGQLAGGILQMTDHLPKVAPPVLTDKDKKIYNSNDLIQAARLFHDAGLQQESGRFMECFLAADESPKAYRFSAEMAAQMGQYFDAVRIAKKATQKGLFLTAQSYPTITKWVKQINTVEWALVHAVIRQESMFDYNALSPAGARGLMQIMPATAREVSNKLKVNHSDSWLTSRPDHNILLGTTYMSRLLSHFNDSYPLAIAAYNAGPGRVDQWIEKFGDPRTGEIDMVDWIELIPYSETRNYVQRVMEGVYVYRLRLKGVQKDPEKKLYIARREE